MYVITYLAKNIFFSSSSSKAGKVTDRAQLLVLFKSDLISPLFQAVEAANLKTMQGEDDQHYLFLKRMVQILVELGGQVCGIWSASASASTSKPENFNIYLNALLAFTNHNSLVVNYYANELWAKFCRHAEIFKDDIFQTFIPKWVECALKKVIFFYILRLKDHLIKYPLIRNWKCSFNLSGTYFDFSHY